MSIHEQTHPLGLLSMVYGLCWRFGFGTSHTSPVALGRHELIERALLGLPFGPTGIVICILIATFLLGFFLDWLELTLIILPLVGPVVAALEFDPVWFTVMFAVCLQTSFLTPPVGGALFYLRGIAPPGVDLEVIYKGVVPFIVIQLVGLAIIFNWEALATWLPAQAYGFR